MCPVSYGVFQLSELWAQFIFIWNKLTTNRTMRIEGIHLPQQMLRGVEHKTGVDSMERLGVFRRDKSSIHEGIYSVFSSSNCALPPHEVLPKGLGYLPR